MAQQIGRRRRGGVVRRRAATAPSAARTQRLPVIDATRVCSITANLGDTKTTITHPASTSHGRLTEEQRLAAGITQGMIRVAVGLDDVDDIKADLLRGLATLTALARAGSDRPGAHPHRAVADRLPPPRHRAHRAVSRGPSRATTAAQFVLRIEDTDVARSTQDSVDQILAAMHWLGLDHDEGPIYQMQRLDRYQRGGRRRCSPTARAYRCYCTPEELEAMREAQRARGEKTRYDGRWRPEPGKTLPPVPEGVQPVVRFRNPPDGAVTWDDLVKGPITISNRRDRRPGHRRAPTACRPTTSRSSSTTGTWRITPRVPRRRARQQHAVADQHLPRARRAAAACSATCRSSSATTGRSCRKRRGAVSVTRLRGRRLPARGDAQLPGAAGLEPRRRRALHARAVGAWFDGSHLAEEPGAVGRGQARLGQRAPPQAWPTTRGWRAGRARSWRGAASTRRGRRRALAQRCALFKDRCATDGRTGRLAGDVRSPTSQPSAEDLAAHVTEAVRPALRPLARASCATVDVGQGRRSPQAIKETLAAHGLKMPQLAHAAARAGVRPRADAVARRRARAVRPRASCCARLPSGA